MDDLLQDAERRMKHAVDAMLHDFSTYRTGRANPIILERVHAEYYGVETPVNQIATISVPEARQLLITPYDKAALAAIERAILKSDLGINPNNDGIAIRLNFPPMNEERRRDLVKIINQRSEQACVAIRNVRRDAIEHERARLKTKEATEDDVKLFESKVQKITDRYIAEVHDQQKKKDAELMEV